MTAEEFKKRALEEIGLKPLDRISKPVQDALEADPIFDSHIHIFDKDSINTQYFIVRFLQEKISGSRSIEEEPPKAEILQSLQQAEDIEEAYRAISAQKPFNNWLEISDAFDKNFPQSRSMRLSWELASFLTKYVAKEGMQPILEDFLENAALNNLAQFQDRKLITAVLMMDMGKAWHTEASKSVSAQIEELRQIATQHPILPFFAIDPRRAEDEGEEHLYELFLKAFKKVEGSFFGVKVYPCLGYLPEDYRLLPIYEICEQLQIPITTHCGGETVSSFDEKIKVYDINGQQHFIDQGSRVDNAFYLNDAERWRPVLEGFPKLRLNFAHFGSEKAWDDQADELPTQMYQARVDTIKEFLAFYDHVYSDFSFNVVVDDTYENFNQTALSNDLLQKKVIYGTDYWVALFYGNMLDAQQAFFEALDDSLIEKLVLENPMHFFFPDK
jgi:predicted TIM-barrel fold metal-dependent hydrolase